MAIIDELIIRLLQGRASDAEEDRLQRWKKDGRENAARFNAIEGVWSLTGLATPAVRAGVDLDVDVVIEEAESREGRRFVSRRERADGVEGSTWRRCRAFGRTVWLAASVAILAIGGTLYRATGSEAVAYSEIVTGEGELATYTLADGTAIRVGPESTLSISQERDRVTVELDGRAFFGVRPDRTRLFTVRTKYGEATALGTRFEVQTDEQEFRVLVVEGSVRVSAAGVALELEEGLMSQGGEGAALSTSRVEDVEQWLGWMGRTLMFQDTPLESVITEIEARYGLDVDLEDGALRTMTVTATFTNHPIETVLAVVCESIGAVCSSESGKVRIAAGD